MKSIFNTRLLIVVVIGVLAACSAATPEDDKKARLDKLKADHAEMSKEIAKLEAEVASENPDTTATVRSKEVSVTEITPRKFDHYVQTQGWISSENNVQVSAKAMGAITRIYVSEGDAVTKGQIMAQIDNSIIVRSIESMKAQLELATSVYERQKNLWDQKIGTEVQYLQAKSGKESLEKQIASLEEQNDLSRIKAPFSGTVDEVLIKEGETVSPGMPAIRVVNNADLKIEAGVSEAYITDIKKGNKVIITIPELEKDVESKVTFVGRTIDPLSRTFKVEIGLPSQPDLRTNMSATIRVIFFSEPSSMVVPINVVQTINNEKIVYVAEANGKQTIARRKVVTVDGVYGNQASVKGLNPGDKVITFGYQGLNDGEFVKI